MNKKSLIIIVAVLIVIWAFLWYRQNNLNNLHSTETEQAQNTDWPVCVDDYDPVCWVDNKTHSNECVATKIDNVQVQYKWQCKDTETVENVSEIKDASWSENWDHSSVDLSDNSSTWTLDNSWNNTSSSWAITATWELDWVKLSNYENSNYKYWFSLPYATFFAWYGSQWWSSHSVWINTGSWITSFDESAVKVFYYKWKTLSELENTEDWWKIVDKNNWRTYLKLGDNSIIIEAKEWTENIVQTILKTIYAK